MPSEFEQTMISELATFYREFGEPAQRTARGESTATTLTARVKRQQSEFKRKDERATEVLHKATLLVFSVVDATYGGVLAPVPGDTWKVALTQGGALIDGWQAGAPAGKLGQWEIPVTYLERIEVGGKRQS